MPPIPDLVQVSKLDTRFHSDPESIQHVKYVSGSTSRQRRIHKEEYWNRERGLGHGSFGIVWLERCVQGDTKGEVRAVKGIRKLESGDYYRELEAIALFSHAKYEQCFVKSFGWYEDEDSIFITMEYLPHGDLHKYLRAPLSEKEGQHIVFQVLEGLRFMHDNGFAHRDLKPTNILVVCKGPDWWVKIADFGISKRASDGLTALRTLTGTPAFAAPEALGFSQPGDKLDDSYTNAVDIWSLSVIAFLVLTGETLFKDQRRLGRYVAGSLAFPSNDLLANKVSAQGCDFIRRLMAPKSEDRPVVKECLQHSWVRWLMETPETQREVNISKFSSKTPDSVDPEPSASWSTQDQIWTRETHRHMGVLAEEGTHTSNSINALSTTENVKTAAPSIASSDTIYAPSTPRSKEIVAPSKSAPNKIVPLPTPELAGPFHYKKLRTLIGHEFWISAVAFSPDGKLIASASQDQTIKLWDPITGIMERTLKGHSDWVSAVTFSPDGKLITSASTDRTIKLWDPITGIMQRTLKNQSGSISTVTFSPDGKLMASASYDKTIKLWNPITGIMQRTLKGHSDSVMVVTFSPDGKLMASASVDKSIKLWDPITGIMHRTLKGHSALVSAVTFSPDGKLMASASYDKTIKLWDPIIGIIHRTLKDHSAFVNAVTFSPDGKLIASASADETVKIWDLVKGTMCHTLRGHSDVVSDVKFSPNGKMIASASDDCTVKLWGLGMEEETSMKKETSMEKETSMKEETSMEKETSMKEETSMEEMIWNNRRACIPRRMPRIYGM